jgi:predicted nucleic acid-binding protein
VLLVLDASAIVELLFQTLAGKRVSDIIFEPNINLCAPELLTIETIQVIRRFINSKEISTKVADSIFNDLKDLPISYYPHHILLNRAWDLRKNFTAYDATYISLAEALKAPLITCDSAFKKGSGSIHQAKVILIKPTA